jgi:hypothetical protein
MQTSTDAISPNYSVGWGTALVFGHRALTHTGGMPGVSTIVRGWPEEGAALVVLTNGDGHGMTGEVSERIGSHLFPDAKGPRPSVKVPSSTSVQRFVGRWKGELVHFDGNIPVELNVEDKKTVRIRFGTASRQLVQDLELDRKTLSGQFKGKLRTQPSFHGTCDIRLRLTVEEDRMTGVGIAMADGYFALSHWMALKRISEDAP